MLGVLVSCVPLVAGHGGILYPPTWQAGEATPIEEITSFKVYSDPPARDPMIPWLKIKELNVWLTNQAYLRGHGVSYSGKGNATNPECSGAGWNKKKCESEKTPWGAPGRAISLGGGCGIDGWNKKKCESEKTPWGAP